MTKKIIEEVCKYSARSHKAQRIQNVGIASSPKSESNCKVKLELPPSRQKASNQQDEIRITLKASVISAFARSAPMTCCLDKTDGILHRSITHGEWF